VNNKYKYKAFISYSHRDERWASWLHRALESYRVPRKLVGKKTGPGEVPARIKPVFRDRDELSSTSDLSGTVKQALADSENLVVVCSPAAAASKWVNREIQEFAGLGRENQIFFIIVDGELAGDGSVSACFPDALAEIGIQEPLAADARKWADGNKLARLKLIAGMLGLPLDQLRRRDLQKRQKVWALALIASIAVTAVMIVAVTARISAQQRRDLSESLVALKLNDLRTMLNLTHDPEELTRLKQWDQQSLARLIGYAGVGEKALFNSAMEMRSQGIDYWRKSEFAEALEKFEQSWVLFAEDYRGDRSNLQSFFELGQAEYWIGLVYWDQGELDRAEEMFMTYAEITRRLIQLQPKNAEWVLEMSYALTNLGNVQTARDKSDPQRSLQLMQSALEYNQLALVLDPNNTDYRSELGPSHANLATAQYSVCDLEGALQSRQENVLLETGLLQEDSENTTRIRRLALALYGYAQLQETLGQLDAAKDNQEESLRLLQLLLERNPGVVRTKRRILERKQRIVRLIALNGDTEEAWAASVALAEDWQDFHQGRSSDDIRTTLVYLTSLHDRAILAKARGDIEMPARLFGYVIERLTSLLQNHPDNRTAGNMLVHAVFQEWEIKQTMPPARVQALLPEYSDDSERTRSCSDAGSAVSKYIMFGDKARAAQLVTYLLDSGYRDVGFMRTCESYSLCSGQ